MLNNATVTYSTPASLSPAWPLTANSLTLPPKTTNITMSSSLQHLPYQQPHYDLSESRPLKGLDSSEGVATVLQDRIDTQNKVIKLLSDLLVKASEMMHSIFKVLYEIPLKMSFYFKDVNIIDDWDLAIMHPRA